MSTPLRMARVTPLAVTLVALLLLHHTAIAMEVKAFAIGDFVPSEEGGCGGADRGPTWNNMVDAWYDEMADHGHSKDGQYDDGNMTLRRFCDPDTFDSDCQDHLFVDEADAAMIATHGKDVGNHWSGTMRAPFAGECAVEGGGTALDMHVGDVDLEFLHLSSCNSMDDDYLFNNPGNRGPREALTDPVDGGFAHLITGFHGVMYIRGKYIADNSDFAHDAHAVGIALAWVVNQAHFNDECNDDGVCQDICPVAVSQGQSANRAWNGIQYERYNNVYSDPTGNGYWYWMAYEGCDSFGETAFNPDNAGQ
jgi:Family of unknown function (DUF6345)